jgi:protein TonB
MIFEESLIVTLPQRNRRSVRGFFVGTVIGYSFIITTLLVGSILFTRPELNETLMGSVLISPPPPPPPPPPPAGGAARPVSQPAGVRIITAAFVPPTVTSRRLPTANDLPGDDDASPVGVSGGVEGGVPGGVVGGVLGGVVGGVLGSTPAAAAAPPPPQPVQPDEARPTPPSAPARPQRVSTGILLGNTIRQVPAAYPAIARSTQVEGVVEVQVIVDEQGNVVAADVLSGHPLLRKSAVEAARQWKFRPTMLNDQSIKISGVLKFTFKLS